MKIIENIVHYDPEDIIDTKTQSKSFSDLADSEFPLRGPSLDQKDIEDMSELELKIYLHKN